MIRALYRAPRDEMFTDYPLADLRAAIDAADGLLWVDCTGEPTDRWRQILVTEFGFHPLAVADALEQSHVPKVDDWVDYVYVVLHAVTFDAGQDEPLETLELDAFLGPNYVVTYAVEPIAALDRAWSMRQHHEHQRQFSAARLFYGLVDEVVGDYLPVVEQIDEAIDRVEDEVFGNPASSVLERIFSLKRTVLHLRRIVAPQREVLNKLARGDFVVIRAEDRVYFRDVYDHLVRVYDIAETLRDLITSSLDSYLSVVNNRMNDIMKTLTLITTVFLPAAFLTGFFGMNFFAPAMPMAAWTSRAAFVAMLAGTALLPLGLYSWLQRVLRT